MSGVRYLNGWLGGVCVVTVPEGSQERLFLRKKRNHRERLSGSIERCLGKIRTNNPVFYIYLT